MNLKEYKVLIKDQLTTDFPDIESNIGSDSLDKLAKDITKKPLRLILDELDSRIGTGVRYDETVAKVRTEFEIDGE